MSASSTSQTRIYNQVGLDVLEYECSLLKEEIQEYREYIHPSDKRYEKLNKYTEKLQELYAYHDPKAELHSYDALEFIYQDFLSTESPIILHTIENFFSNTVDDLLSNGLVHFTFFAKRLVAYILFHHAASSIVDNHLSTAKLSEIEKINLGLSDEDLSSFSSTCKEYSQTAAAAMLSVSLENQYHKKISIINQKYRYFEDRLSHNLEIGNKIRELKRF